MQGEVETKTNPMDNLLSIMNIPKSFDFVDITKTSDGHFIGMKAGDCGFNHFLGRPSKPHPGPGRDRMLSVWGKLDKAEKLAVLLLAATKRISLRDEFGVPIE
jgi:hypothetical protein